MDFKSEIEYKSFLNWSLNGSTMGQRMQQGNERPIPDYWHDWGKVFRNWPQSKRGPIPKTLADFNNLFLKGST